MKLASTLVAIAGLWLAGSVAAAPARPVVVELYTSQSCGTCVPADRMLARLARRHDVIALTFSVNYWDILGWKDTLASEGATRRQKAYAAALGRGGVYTPQMIVDGVRDAVGSREDDVDAAIADTLKAVARCDDRRCRKRPALPTDPVTALEIDAVRMEDGTIRVALPGLPPGGRKYDAWVWLFTLRHDAAVKIDGGENKGKTLSYRNVVEDIKLLGKWNGAPGAYTFSFEGAKAAPQDDAVVVVQQGGFGRVIGALLVDSSHNAKHR